MVTYIATKRVLWLFSTTREFKSKQEAIDWMQGRSYTETVKIYTR